MKTALRILTGFILLAAYRAVLATMQPFVAELNTLGGDAFVQLIAPLLITAAICSYGFLATFIIHLIDKGGN